MNSIDSILAPIEKRQITNADIETLEGAMLEMPQIECPLVHLFAPGVYYREIFMPAGAKIIGQEHKTEHLNIVLTGRATVWTGEQVEEIKAPCTFISKPGVRKVLHILEDMRWITIHPTDETDLVKLEDMLITKSQTFLTHAENQKLTHPESDL